MIRADDGVVGKKIILLGAGGHARVLMDAIKRMGLSVFGMTVNRSDIPYAATGISPNVLGDDTAIAQYPVQDVLLVNGVGASLSTRRQLYERFSSKGYRFMSVVDPTADLASDTQLASGAQIMMGVSVQPGVHVGENAIVNTRASIDHDCQIGAHVHIAPGAVVCGGVRIGRGSFIGAAAVVVQNVTIPENAFVKAGTLVSQRTDMSALRIRGGP